MEQAMSIICGPKPEDKILEIMDVLNITRDVALKHIGIQENKRQVDERMMQVKINNAPGNPSEYVDRVVNTVDAEPEVEVAPVVPVDTGSVQEKATKMITKYINTSAKKHLPKEQVKTKIATQFIGEGSEKSSTDNYKKMYETLNVANTGNYTESDIV